MDKKKKIIIAVLAVVLGGSFVYFTYGRDSMRSKNAKPISIEGGASAVSQTIQNDGPVSPITGLSCENWNRRPVAVMQPSDIQARPAAGFSEADMVIEMPGYTSSVTRLMGVYLCNFPQEVGAIRSSRHDYIHLAKGLDAVFVHWGGSAFALNLLSEGVIDHHDCMSGAYCDRREATGQMRMEDTGRITGQNMTEMMEKKGFRKEGNFSGYPHQVEAPIGERPEKGDLRVAFAKPYDVEYEYNRETNSYLRKWGDAEDTDRNDGERLAPKNVVVMFARSEQITNTQDYAGKGLRNPWAEIEAEKNTGDASISGRYNNVQVGDPWYDDTDSGEAFYYFNGKEYKGTWKKDKSKIDSKLFFYDQSGKEIQFVPGQIWVEILEPGQALRWEVQ